MTNTLLATVTVGIAVDKEIRDAKHKIDKQMTKLEKEDKVRDRKCEKAEKMAKKKKK